LYKEGKSSRIEGGRSSFLFLTPLHSLLMVIH
jgi:hypothetical protein